ncbi:MAG TPA: hypothetical protein DEP84_37920 [Chloroflexi bacterium]|nr:hypothetical protein [Chloroflexota bacterium]
MSAACKERNSAATVAILAAPAASWQSSRRRY